MSVFGDRLRREREMRSVTLEEISESTKISKRSLQALEEEHFKLLPGGIFNKGFVRAYARYLGIDEEQAVADYLAASQEQEPAEEQFPLEAPEETTPVRRKRSILPLTLAAAAFLMILGGWKLWTRYQVQQQPDSAVPAAPVPASSLAIDEPGKNAPPEKAEQAGKATNQGQPDASVSSHAGVNPGPGSTSGPQASQSQASQPRPFQSQPSGAQASGPANSRALHENSPPATHSLPDVLQPSTSEAGTFNISVKAKEVSWVRIVADGKTVMQGTLDADQQRSAKAGKKIVLTIGNAGGVEVIYNGKPLGALGKEDEPRTLTFDPAGLQPANQPE